MIPPSQVVETAETGLIIKNLLSNSRIIIFVFDRSLLAILITLELYVYNWMFKYVQSFS